MRYIYSSHSRTKFYHYEKQAPSTQTLCKIGFARSVKSDTKPTHLQLCERCSKAYEERMPV